MIRADVKPCPFCGDNKVHVGDVKTKWMLWHFCVHEENEAEAHIDIYGKTEQEIIDKWNKLGER